MHSAHAIFRWCIPFASTQDIDWGCGWKHSRVRPSRGFKSCISWPLIAHRSRSDGGSCRSKSNAQYAEPAIQLGFRAVVETSSGKLQLQTPHFQPSATKFLVCLQKLPRLLFPSSSWLEWQLRLATEPCLALLNFCFTISSFLPVYWSHFRESQSVNYSIS